MKKTITNLYQKIMYAMPYALCSVLLICGDANSAVVQRGAAKAASAAANRISGTKVQTTPASAVNTAPVAEPAPAAATADTNVAEPTPAIAIENKSTKFAKILDACGSDTDRSAQDLAEQIRRQRAALNSQSTIDATTNNTEQLLKSGNSTCDTKLRKCMQSKCGNDYLKCSGDSDTIWGNKIESCRRDTQCTGTEFTAYAAEVKADRDMNVRLGSFDSIIDCGKQYSNCIIQQCGTTYDKCLGKKGGDVAISACATIAKNCAQQDSGLAQRTMTVFGTLRQDAETQVKADEERLYALRDQMKSICNRMGALFDERSLDCVYTVNLYAGGDATVFASRKVYAGKTFDCTPNWFGVDITTFKENAYRATREQTAASSAMLGAGVGSTLGMATSGMFERAIERQNANKALKEVQNSQGGVEPTPQ